MCAKVSMKRNGFQLNINLYLKKKTQSTWNFCTYLRVKQLRILSLFLEFYFVIVFLYSFRLWCLASFIKLNLICLLGVILLPVAVVSINSILLFVLIDIIINNNKNTFSQHHYYFLYVFIFCNIPAVPD